ncbi:translocation/assembly module TamB domain-containing protein [Novispirillum sp. DQ9]|uniref:translocation/assembly module TamB domain-containing protein n=1 Tax=Novispirillum sp. DQ9 TaxID=3398612 RepID=UPI003C7BA37D
MIWLRRVLIAVVVLTAVVLVGLWALLGTQAGSRWVVAQGLEAAAGTVRLARVDGRLLDRVTVHGLEVADAEGVWLTAEEATVSWSPSRLLGGRLWIDLLAATEVAVLRPPAPAPEDPAAEDAAPFDLTQLERLTVRALDLNGLRLAEPVLGTPMAFAAKGRVTGTEGGGVRAGLEAERLDAPGGATAEVVHHPGGTLEVHVAAFEPAGGAVARLLQLPGLPAVRVALDGEGAASDWTGAFLAEAEDFVSIEADLALALAGEAASATVSGTARPGPLMPAEITAATGEALAFAATVGRSAEGVLSARAVALDGQGWTLRGEGLLHPRDGVAADAVLEVTDGAALEGVTGIPVGQGRVAARARGPLDAVEVTADVTLNDTLVRHAEVRARAVLGGAETPFAAEGTVGGVEELVPQAAPVVGEALTFAVTGTAALPENRVAIDRLTVQSPVMGAEYVGVIDLAPLAVSGGLEASITDLAALEPLTGVPLRGVAVLGVDLRADQDAIAGDLRVTLRDFATGIAQADALVAGAVDATGAVTWRGDTLRLGELRLRAPGASLDGGVTLGGFRTLDGAFVVEAPALARLNLGVTGAVRAEGTIGGTLAEPVLTAQVRGRDVVASGFKVTQPGATLRITPQRLAVENVRAGVAGVRIAGGVVLPFDSGLLDGAVDLRMESSEAFAEATGQPLSGSLGGTVELAPREGGQAVTLRLNGESLALPDAGVAVSSLNLRADLTDVLAAPGGRIEAQIGDGGAGGVTWQAGTLTATLEDGGGSFSGRLQGPETAAYQAQVDGRLSLGEATAVRLDTLAVTGQGHAVRLLSPTTLTLAPGGGMALAPTRLGVDGGTVDLRADLGGGRIDLSVTGRQLPLTALEAVVATYPVTGTVSLDATLQGPLTGPTGSVRLQSSRLSMPEAGVEGFVIEAGADIARNRLSARMRLGGVTPEPAVLTADLPLIFSPDGVPSVPGSEPLSAAIDWRGPVQSVWALVPQVGHRLAGEAVVEARVAGTLDAPRFSGQAVMRNGAYENMEWGTVLRELQLTAALTPTGDISLQAQATDGGSGRLELSGTIDNAGPESDVTATLTLDGLQVARRDDLKAGVSGTVAYRGSLETGAVTGDLRTDTVRYTIGAAFGGGIPELNVEEVNIAALGRPERGAEAGGAGGGAAGPAFGEAITLNVRIVMPNRIYVTGQGLDSEWQGELTVGGTAARPSIVGQLTVVRGTFSAVNRTFVLETGVVEFTGGDEINPMVTVRAVYEAPQITAIVVVTGPANDLDFALESRPSLPQDEIIARVLFGRGMGELGAAEALAVAQTAAQLAGLGGGGPGILQSIRGALNLDVLNVGAGAGGPTVEAGRYIGENVYIGVERGAGQDSGTSVEVEVELAPGVTLETRGSAERGADIGVQWKFDY